MSVLKYHAMALHKFVLQNDQNLFARMLHQQNSNGLSIWWNYWLGPGIEITCASIKAATLLESVYTYNNNHNDVLTETF